MPARKMVEPFIVLICGDRVDRPEYAEPVYKDVANLKAKIGGNLMILHGGCTGIDALAGQSARYLGIPEIRMPAEWEYYLKAAGPIRNGWMLWLRPKLVMGFHCNWKQSRGTVDMLDRAAKAKIQVVRRTIRVKEA